MGLMFIKIDNLSAKPHISNTMFHNFHSYFIFSMQNSKLYSMKYTEYSAKSDEKLRKFSRNYVEQISKEKNKARQEACNVTNGDVGFRTLAIEIRKILPF